jgi:hypothetical protein
VCDDEQISLFSLQFKDDWLKAYSQIMIRLVSIVSNAHIPSKSDILLTSARGYLWWYGSSSCLATSSPYSARIRLSDIFSHTPGCNWLN